MSGLRARTRKLCERIGILRANDNGVRGPEIDSSAIIAHALYHREREGHETSLRQLHLISDLNQPEALRIVDELERSGMVRLDRNLHDALDTRVELTPHIRARLSGILEAAGK